MCVCVGGGGNMLVKYLLSLTNFLVSTAPVEDHVFGYFHSVLDEGLVHLLSREEPHSHSGTTHTHTHTYTVALLTHTHARTHTHTHTHTHPHTHTHTHVYSCS